MATSGNINGTLLRLYVNDTTDKPIANLVSNDMTFTRDLIEVTSKSSSGAKEFMYGHFGGSGSFEGRFEDDSVDSADYSPEQLLDDLQAGSTMAVVFTTNVTGDLKFSASALIGSLSFSAPDNDAASFSGDITLTGAMTKGTVPA